MRRALLCLGAAVGLLACQPVQSAPYDVLHHFELTSTNGSDPWGGALVVSGGMLYGMTPYGGGGGGGAVFRMKLDGSDYEHLHDFTGGPDDGYRPHGQVTLSGGKLYGMTELGGNDNMGVVFEMGIDGSDYTLRHEFTGAPNDGGGPWGSLALQGGKLYGMTRQGGSYLSGYGTIFRMDPDGSNYEVLHSFAGPDDGYGPYGSVTVNGDVVYGMTYGGGFTQAQYGVVFRMDADGGNYEVLKEFTPALVDPEDPYGSLCLVDGRLYGMAHWGGDGGNQGGLVFGLDTDGDNYDVLHAFAPSPDIHWPFGSLIADGDTLYGMASRGGADDAGAIFSITTAGTAYTLVHEFAGYPTDGTEARGDLTLYNGVLYGMTMAGGENDDGVIFGLALRTQDELIPEPGTLGLLLLGGIGILARRRRR